MFNQPKLVCFGCLTLDDIVHPGKAAREAAVGGNALYGILAARLFESQSQMVAPVGADFPPRARSALAAQGVSADGLPVRARPTLRTGYRHVARDEPGMSLLSSAADLDDLSPDEADVPARFWGAEAFLVLGMTLRSQSALIRACRAHGSGIVALDFCLLYNVDKKAEALELVGHADVFLADLADIRFVLGDVGPEPGARYFARLGPRIVAIRMGELGCLVYDRGQDRCFVQPPYRSSTVDRTGSGDAFCSAFMACMIQPGATLEWAAAAGAVAASFASSGHGTEGLFAARPLDAAKRLALYLRPLKA